MIAVKDLSYTYPRASDFALKDLQFAINAGEIFGFLGPSGAGKSTCQKILYKIISKYQGKIEIDGRNLNSWDKDFFEKIGVGFELPNHYGKLTAKENLDLFAAFYPPNRCEKRLDLMKMVGLGNEVDKRVAAYSKGMKMRLNFVRAIMHDPDILFFDEPTAGMDPINAHIIKQHIVRLKEQGKTIFITTHDMTTADELCDRVSFIVDGELVLTESPAALKLRHGQSLVRVESDNGQIKDFPLEDLGNNLDFQSFIKREPIRRIHTLEATLEKVFIDITGTSLKS